MAAQKISGIYKVVNTINGHKYVGSAVDIKRRWHRHKWHLNRNEHHSPKLQNTWNKYGEEAFKFSVIEECEPIKEVLLVREQFWIDELHAYGETGYNMAKIAGSPMSGRKHTEETLKMMSESQKGKKRTDEQKLNMSEANRRRPPVSEETRRKRSAFKKGQKHTDESKAKIGAAHKGRKYSTETLKKMSDIKKGKKVGPETRAKISAAFLGKTQSKEAVAARMEGKRIKREERLIQLPIVLAKLLFTIYSL